MPPAEFPVNALSTIVFSYEPSTEIPSRPMPQNHRSTPAKLNGCQRGPFSRKPLATSALSSTWLRREPVSR